VKLEDIEDDEEEDEEDIKDEDEEDDRSIVVRLENEAKLIQASGGLWGTKMASECLAPVSRSTASA